MTYDPATLRMTGMSSLGWVLSYNYRVPGMGATENGHIYDIVDNYNASNSQHFEYDRWYRLTGYWRSNARTDPYSIKLTWVYDQYGNITSATREYPPQSRMARS
jgi:YD repeat-containing protein